MAKAFSSLQRVRITVGDETVTMVLQTPTAEQHSSFLKSRFVAKGRKVENNAYEERVAFVNVLLVDVDGATYETAAGEERPLNARVVLSEEDRVHAERVLRRPVESWKDLVPASWKSSAAQYFEDAAPEGN